MDTAAIAIPIPVQPIEPAQPAPGPDIPAAPDGVPSDFASALEQQLSQAALLGADPVHPAPAADADAAVAAVDENPTTPDALLALMAAPAFPPAPPTIPAHPRRADVAAAIASAHGEPRGPLQRDAAPEQPAALPDDRQLERVAGMEVKLAAQAVEQEAAATPLLQPAEAPGPSSLAALHGGLAQAPQSAAPAGSEPQIAARVGSAGWGDGLARQVTIMVKDGEQTAQLRLDPPELGPLEVRLSMARDQEGVAHAQFVSAHATVRDALEAALPQLRAALAESGITLGQASVGEGYARDEAREPHHSRGNAAGQDGAGGRGDMEAPRAIVRHGLVDTFA